MLFSKLAQYFSRIEATPKRLEITAILADLLKESSPEEIDKICYLVLGQLAPLYEGVEFNLAGKMLLRVMTDAYMVPGAEVEKIAKEKGDLGDVAEELAERCMRSCGRSPRIPEPARRNARSGKWRGSSNPSIRFRFGMLLGFRWQAYG